METQVGHELMFESYVSINAAGSYGISLMWFDANSTILGNGKIFVADITMRWFVESTFGCKRAVPLSYIELSKHVLFNISASSDEYY